MITNIAHGEADLDILKAGASLIPAAKITKVPKVVKAIGNVGKTGLKKGREGDKTVWKRFTQKDQPKPDKNKGNQSKAGSKSGSGCGSYSYLKDGWNVGKEKILQQLKNKKC